MPRSETMATAEAVGLFPELVHDPSREPAGLARAPFGDDERGARLVAFDLHGADVVHGAGGWRLHMHFAAHEALDADSEERARLVDDRQRVVRRSLIRLGRDPV